MLLSFDKSVPVHEQLIRANMAKRVKFGHKHQHNGPGRVRAKKAANHAAHLKQVAKARKMFKLQVAAYWQGLRNEFPA